MPANLNSIMCLGLAMALGATGSVRGQEAYPAKPIRIIVPFAPGGPNDIISRLVGKKLFEKWGQQVIVDSRPGGNTVIGSELAASSNPDGYTLLIVSTSTTVNPSLMKKLPYDTLKDFASVVRLTASPNILVTPPSLPVTSVRELIEAAGATLRFLPPYSPDFNPIEKAFSKLKAMLRKIGERSVSGLWDLIGRLVDIFLPRECANYFTSCGYNPD